MSLCGSPISTFRLVGELGLQTPGNCVWLYMFGLQGFKVRPLGLCTGPPHTQRLELVISSLRLPGADTSVPPLEPF